MIKITALGLTAALMLTASAAFATDKDKACCADKAANKDGKTLCTDLASLNLTADQKAKIDAWQAECMKDGCTKESRHKFMQQAKGILSAEQFAKLKAACKKSAGDKEKTQA